MATSTQARELTVDRIAMRFASPLRITGYIFDAMPSVVATITAVVDQHDVLRSTLVTGGAGDALEATTGVTTSEDGAGTSWYSTGADSGTPTDTAAWSRTYWSTGGMTGRPWGAPPAR